MRSIQTSLGGSTTVTGSAKIVVRSIRSDIRGDRVLMLLTSGNAFGQELVTNIARDQGTLIRLREFFFAAIVDDVSGAVVEHSRYGALEAVVTHELFGELSEISLFGSTDWEFQLNQVRARDLCIVGDEANNHIVIAFVSIIVGALAVRIVGPGFGASAVFVVVSMMKLFVFAMKIGTRVASLGPLAITSTARVPLITSAARIISIDAKFALTLLPPATVVVFSSILIRPVLRKAISQRIEVSGLTVIHPILCNLEIKRMWDINSK